MVLHLQTRIWKENTSMKFFVNRNITMVKDYTVAILILIFILLLVFIFNTVGSNAGFLVTLLIGLYFVINFKSIGLSVSKYYILIPLPKALKKWNLIYAQLHFLVFGIIFIIISIYKIIESIMLASSLL